MIKVLYVVDGYSYGGIGRFCDDIKKHINNDISIDILSASFIKDDWINLDTNRSTIIGKIKYNHKLNKYLKENKYDIIHIHSGVFLFGYQVIRIAKINRIKTIIVHSHSTPHCSKFKKILISLLRPSFSKNTNIMLACSSNAANSLFGKNNKAKIINNGININDFKFNNINREKYRKEFNIKDSVLYGYVANFSKNKNQEFLIKLFNKIKDKQNAKLMLIGEGNTIANMEHLVESLGLKDKALFLGYRNDVNLLLNAIDIFVFPSKSEGLGLVAIEAQTNGLITYCSEYIPNEVNISPYYRSFSINDDINLIAKDMSNNVINIKKRSLAYQYTKNNGFDINDVCKELESIYKSIR